ncbi:MAG TPA: SURF1 family protein [Burkholderiales bacterium]|nr:SURF1 family protein [Burkholderiales bacterium]
MTARRFRPGLAPTLATLLLVPLFVHLGNWQWGKAERKAAQQALLESRMKAPPVTLTGGGVDAESLRYAAVRVRGRYEPQFQILLDNQVWRGRAGFHVVTPLRIEGSAARVLVDRGWVPFSGDRSKLPEVPVPQDEMLEVAGHAMVPPDRFFELGAPPAARAQWEPVWQNLDLRRYRERVPFEVLPVVVRMDPGSDAGGFMREWPRPDEKIGMHRGYAWQWWALAAALTGAWVYFGLRRGD